MNLNTFEIAQNIRSKKFSKAEVAINFFITDVAENNASLAIPTSNDPMANKSIDVEELHYTLCNQFSSLISELFGSSSYKPSKETINVFLKYKFVIEWIFSASLWNNTDALIEHLGLIKVDAAGKIKLNKRNYLPLLMLITISSKYKLSWLELIKLDKYTSYIAYTCLLTQPIPALTKESNIGFNYLLESARNFPLFELPTFEDLGRLNFPFFACSYATSPNKYEFKKWLTSQIRHNLPQWLSPITKNYIENVPLLRSQHKMKIGIMLEQYSQDHAMYRCFNSAISGIAEQYELIAFTDKKDTDKADLSTFDKVVVFQDVFEVNANIELICQENIDVLFYPSIGMKFWGIYLSQLRLAPMQVMMGGHPSSSFSPEIDYILLPLEQHQVTDCLPYFSEKIVTAEKSWKELNTHVMHSDLTSSFIEEHNHFLAENNQIKIAINGVLTKVTHSIIDVCKKIQERSTKKVIFIFFSAYSSNHLAYLSAKSQLKKELKLFELSPFTDYLEYMNVISKCHMLLPTLPFGGSNSNIDAMILNKPKFFIKGKAQIYTKSDLWEWERLGLVDELGCENENELIEKSINIIENEASRRMLYDLMVKKCTMVDLFDNDNKANEAITHLLSQAMIQEENNDA